MGALHLFEFACCYLFEIMRLSFVRLIFSDVVICSTNRVYRVEKVTGERRQGF